MIKYTNAQLCRPKIEVIDGRHYRINPSLDDQNYEKNPQFHENNEPFVSDGRIDDMLDSVSCVDTSDLEKTREGYVLKVHIPSRYYGCIIGKKRETLKRIEHETHTQITVPRGNDILNDIRIVGREPNGPVSARTRIELLVLKAKEREPFTNFISMPFNSEEMIDSLAKFKEQVMECCGDARGLSERLFQTPRKLHLTFGTMVLASAEEERMAKEVIQASVTDIIKPILAGEPLKVRVRGIEYMNDDPSEVDVLYAKVEPMDGTNKLQQVADGVVSQLVSAGLMQRQFDRVKLHLTLINTKFALPPPTGPRGGGSQGPEAGGITDSGQLRRHRATRNTFDARNLLKMFGDYDFGVHLVQSLHISARFSTAHDGYYTALVKCPLR